LALDEASNQVESLLDGDPMSIQKKFRFGPLEALSIGPSEASQTIVMLHGYGANMADLAGLAQIRPQDRWIFPEAPLPLESFPGFASKAWFPIDPPLLEKAIDSGSYADFHSSHKREIDHALALLQSAFKEFPTPPEQIILGGFSQGAMLSLGLFLEGLIPFKALALFSAVNLKEAEWESRIKVLEKRAIFQSHGTQDPLLSFSAAEHLAKLFEENDWPIEWVPFNGGHEIPPIVLQKFSEFILSQEQPK